MTTPVRISNRGSQRSGSPRFHGYILVVRGFDKNKAVVMRKNNLR